MLRKYSYRSTVWYVFCAKCGQRYEQRSITAPTICGACGSKFMAAISRKELATEKHIPFITPKHNSVWVAVVDANEGPQVFVASTQRLLNNALDDYKRDIGIEEFSVGDVFLEFYGMESVL